ncbi:MAG: pentapeptide repeat-containing protein [Proteobacteria bacterium]|nr:pentapeptide repeat-containing protein [Pseudomonadota bacterium]
MDRKELSNIIKGHLLFVHAKRGGVKGNLTLRDVSGADFSGLDMSSFKASGAVFNGSSLAGADLRDVDLDGVDLGHCNTADVTLDPPVQAPNGELKRILLEHRT